MDFSKKLYQLRKEKGLSQEALAEQLGTTRQAISKWENKQGFPEIEKLLQLSHIFAVSLDDLLQAETASNQTRVNFITKEEAIAYLAQEKKIHSFLGLGFFCWALTGIPYVLFTNNSSLQYISMAFCMASGIFFFVLCLFTEQKTYDKETPLCFSPETLQWLSKTYTTKKKRYKILSILSTFFFILGIVTISYTIKGYLFWSPYHAFVFFIFGLGLLGFIITIGMIETYEFFINKGHTTKSFWYKLKRSVTEKIHHL